MQAGLGGCQACEVLAVRRSYVHGARLDKMCRYLMRVDPSRAGRLAWSSRTCHRRDRSIDSVVVVPTEEIEDSRRRGEVRRLVIVVTTDESLSAARQSIFLRRSAFWTASSFLRLVTRRCRLSALATVGSDRSAGWRMPGSAGRGPRAGLVDASLLVLSVAVFLAGSSLFSAEESEQPAPAGPGSLCRGSLDRVVALGGRVFAQDGFEVDPIGDGHGVDDQLAGADSSAAWRFRGSRRSAGRWHPGWPSSGRLRPAPARS